MPSSKGKPTDPELREKVVEDVKNETNKASKIAKEYEKKGGDYENESGSKNKPEKGAPKAKSTKEKDSEIKDDDGEEDVDDEKAVDEEDVDEKPSGPKKAGRPKKSDSGAAKPKKEKKVPTEGTRKSSRATTKRIVNADEDEDDDDDEKPKKKVKGKK